jgi:hypothetical protein
MQNPKKDHFKKASETGIEKLYIDGLNFGAVFGFTNKEWDLRLPLKLIRDFVVTIRNAGITPIVFLDAGIESEEGIEKWKKRREAEVLKQLKTVPQGTTKLMADIFKLYGVEVLFSPESADNDDCIAAYAEINGGHILSNDGDFIRYTHGGKQCNFKVYSQFEMRNNELFIQTKYFNPKKEVIKREILKPLPIMIDSEPSFIYLQKDKIYKRGCPSGLVKLLGNLHIDAKPLRQHLYYIIGITEPIKEIFPTWRDGKFEWHEIETVPEEMDLTKYKNTLEISTALFKDHKKPIVPDLEDWEWNNHLFAMHSIVCELYNKINNNSESLLSSLCKIYKIDLQRFRNFNDDLVMKTVDVEKAPDSCRNFKETGQCKFGEGCFVPQGHKICQYHLRGNCRRSEHCPYYHSK